MIRLFLFLLVLGLTGCFNNEKTPSEEELALRKVVNEAKAELNMYKSKAQTSVVNILIGEGCGKIDDEANKAREYMSTYFPTKGDLKFQFHVVGPIDKIKLEYLTEIQQVIYDNK